MVATRVLQMGLGPIGCAIARLVTERQGLELVAGVDVDPAKCGRDLGEVIGLERALGIEVVASPEQAPAARLALHSTASRLAAVIPQIESLMAAGMDVVSTAEELSFPWSDHRAAAAALDATARSASRTVLATGVNPGFIMDALPLALSGLCQHVEHVEVRRSVDASERRAAFQHKIGAGLSVEEFRRAAAEGRIGHVGLAESLAMISHTLGRRLHRRELRCEPLVAVQPVATEHLQVAAGLVSGLRQEAVGYDQDGEVARLVFTAGLDQPEPGDTIVIRGRPCLTATLAGSHGDLTTAAMVVNAIPRVLEARPGLLTMADLALVSCAG